MAVILSSQDEMRLQRAIRNSPRFKRTEQMRIRMETLKRISEDEKKKEIELFEQWEIMDKFLELLEYLRDANIPKTKDEEWNETFKTAIRMIPDARDESKKLWMEYAEKNGRKIENIILLSETNPLLKEKVTNAIKEDDSDSDIIRKLIGISKDKFIEDALKRLNESMNQ